MRLDLTKPNIYALLISVTKKPKKRSRMFNICTTDLTDVRDQLMHGHDIV